MLNKIWQFLKQLIQRLIQRLFKTQSSHPSAPQNPVPPTLTDAEYEAKFMELLEGVHQGWSRGDVAGFLIAKRLKDAELATWLRRFGENLLSNLESAESEKTEAPTANLDENLNANLSVASLQELAQRLLFLSRIRDGELGNIAREISQEILARFPLPPAEDDGGTGNVIEAIFVGDGLGFSGEVNRRDAEEAEE
jgi:hypothetical protein